MGVGAGWGIAERRGGGGGGGFKRGVDWTWRGDAPHTALLVLFSPLQPLPPSPICDT